MTLITFLTLSAVSLHARVMAQGQGRVVRASTTDGTDQLEQRSAIDPVLRVQRKMERQLEEEVQRKKGRRLEEEIQLESDDDDEEQGADFDVQHSDLLQPLHNHHEFHDLLTGLHSENWADGCRAVFLDVGAKQGTHTQMLFEPEKYGTASTLALLEKYFGPASTRTLPSNESGLCAFGFEANPRFAAKHRAIETAYAERGWKVQFFTPVVVSDHDGAEDFYIQDSLDTNHSYVDSLDLGDSILNGSRMGKYHKQELPSARLAELVRTKVTERMLFEDEIPGKVFMKMEIVDAEYAVLPDLLQAGVLCQQSGIDGMLIVEHTQSLKHVHNNTIWSELKEAISMQNGCKEPSELLEMGLESAYVDTPQLLSQESNSEGVIV